MTDTVYPQLLALKQRLDAEKHGLDTRYTWSDQQEFAQLLEQLRIATTKREIA